MSKCEIERGIEGGKERECVCVWMDIDKCIDRLMYVCMYGWMNE